MLKDVNLTLNTKENIAKIITYFGSDENRIAELMGLFLGDNHRICQVSSWAIGHIGEHHPHLFVSYHSQLIQKFTNKNNHNAIRRNIARIYQFILIPEEIESELFDTSIRNIINSTEAIAIRAFSMKIAERIALKYPELISEVIDAVESTLENGSSGLKNRAKQTIKNLLKAATNI